MDRLLKCRAGLFDEFGVLVQLAREKLRGVFDGVVQGGDVQPDETVQCAEAIRQVIPSIQPGFQLLVDMTDLESMAIGCAPHIKELMDTCNAIGVRRIIRIIPNPKLDIGFQIMSYFHYRDDVHIVTCENLDQALALLAK